MEARIAVAALSALAQDSRLEIFRLLVQQGPGGLPAGTIAARLALPPATLSFHLAQLRHAGLCLSRRDGRQIVYAADYARMNALLSYLTENCCRPDVEAVPVKLQRRHRRGTKPGPGQRP